MATRRRLRWGAQPHDAFVKWAFSPAEHAAGLLRAALPREVAATVDWGSVRPEKDSFIDRGLRAHFSDLVFSARIGEDRVYFYMLLEHQRAVEALMVYRLLLYMVRLWERLVREEPGLKTLPLIVPILLHHSDAGWTAATRFQDVLDLGAPGLAALKRHAPHFEIRLIDLSPGRAADLVEEALTALGRLVLWSLSVAGDDERFVRELPHMTAAIEEVLQAADPHAALEVLLRYLAATRDRMSAEQVSETFIEAIDTLDDQEDIMNFFEELKLIHRREGKREGKLEGKREMLLELLAARFGDLPEDVKERVAAASDATLAKWALRVVTAPTLEAVLARGAAPATTRRRAVSPRAASRTPRT